VNKEHKTTRVTNAKMDENCRPGDGEVFYGASSQEWTQQCWSTRETTGRMWMISMDWQLKIQNGRVAYLPPVAIISLS